MSGVRAFFGRRQREAVERLLSDTARPILLVFDVDGTLAPIAARPDRARVPPRTLRLLGRAARARHVSVAVLSARTRPELARLVPVRGIRRVAQYGIGSLVPVPASKRSSWRLRAEEIAGLLDAVVRGRRPASVERKGVTVALHDRGLPARALGSLRRALRPVAARARALGFEPVRGTRVTEFVPRGHGKARAFRALLRARGPRTTRTVFYWGDSEADEATFAALAHRDYSIKVGPGPTRASYRVNGPRDVGRFLARVLEYRDRRRTQGGRKEAP